MFELTEKAHQEINSIVENLFRNDEYYKNELLDFSFNYIERNVNRQDFNLAYMIAVDNYFTR